MNHHTLVIPALEAGKHVFSEWPLGVATDEAIHTRDVAKAHRIRTSVGLQNQCVARHSLRA
ncbi:hypothetical protein [Mycobacterium hodleri]